MQIIFRVNTSIHIHTLDVLLQSVCSTVTFHAYLQSSFRLYPHGIQQRTLLQVLAEASPVGRVGPWVCALHVNRTSGRLEESKKTVKASKKTGFFFGLSLFYRASLSDRSKHSLVLSIHHLFVACTARAGQRGRQWCLEADNAAQALAGHARALQQHVCGCVSGSFHCWVRLISTASQIYSLDFP